MNYEIVVHELAVEELESLRAYDQRRIIAPFASISAINPALKHDAASA
jgi:hypothetical protein